MRKIVSARMGFLFSTSWNPTACTSTIFPSRATSVTMPATSRRSTNACMPRCIRTSRALEIPTLAGGAVGSCWAASPRPRNTSRTNACAHRFMTLLPGGMSSMFRDQSRASANSPRKPESTKKIGCRASILANAPRAKATAPTSRSRSRRTRRTPAGDDPLTSLISMEYRPAVKNAKGGPMARAGTARIAAAVVTTLVLLAGAAHAQEAGIAGIVKDATGAVLPGVTVTATSPVLIEQQRTAVTDAAGLYVITPLRPGVYDVEFALPGFGTAVRHGINLTSGLTANVEADLRVGGLQETVTVTGASPVVD